MKKLYLFTLTGIALITILFQGCAKFPSDLIMPQWDVDLNVPIATKNYTLADIIKSQNYISVDAVHDSIYLINSDQYSQSVAISDFIKVTTFSDTIAIPVPEGVGSSVYMGFPGGVKLQSAFFKTGKLVITGHNTNSKSANLRITIPGIYKTDNTKFLDTTFVISPQSVGQFTIVLDGYNYKVPSFQPQAYGDLLWISAGLSGTVGGGGFVTFDTKVSDFYFSTITGYLPTKSLGIHNSSFDLNLGDASKYRDKVFLKNAALTLTGNYISSTANPFIVEVKNLQLVGKRNNSSSSLALQFNNNLNDFRFDVNGKLTATYDQSNSNITSFITYLPDSVQISAEYIMNPDNSPVYRTAESSDIVTFTTSFSATSILAIKQTSFGDTLALNIKQDVRDQIVKGQGVNATIAIQNNIPLSSWIKVTLADEFYQPLFVVSKSNTGADSISFPGATVDANGVVLNPAASSTTVSLDSVQIKLLAQKAYYAFVSVTVETTGINNAPVIIRAKDWINLNVFGKVTYRIKKEDNQ